jgi:hypothetical protein
MPVAVDTPLAVDKPQRDCEPNAQENDNKMSNPALMQLTTKSEGVRILVLFKNGNPLCSPITFSKQ